MEKDPETFAIIDAAMEVHRELGRGFLELVYQTAFALELRERGIPFKAEVALPVRYKGKILACAYRADFVCYENIVVETKAISQLTKADEAQLINELKATGIHRGLLSTLGHRVSSISALSSVPLKICVNLRNLWTKSICRRKTL